ncbi:MAG: hypothetical protein ACI4BB_10460 [Coprococcus sp.]
MRIFKQPYRESLLSSGWMVEYAYGALAAVTDKSCTAATFAQQTVCDWQG